MEVKTGPIYRTHQAHDFMDSFAATLEALQGHGIKKKEQAREGGLWNRLQ